jgi:multidrug resistance efflux pump
MPAEHLKPIPIPLSERWRSFRTRVLPVLVFAAAVSAMAVLWQQESSPGMMAGEVYAPAGTISAPRDGWLESTAIEMFRHVRAGEEIAMVRTMPPEHVGLALAVLQEELRMIRLGVGDPVLDQQRNQLSQHGLRRDWLLARSDLAALRVRMRQAEADAARIAILAAQGAESQATLEQARAIHEAMVAEANEKSRLAGTLEAAVQQAGIEQPADAASSGLNAALEWKEAELRRLEAELAPIPIIAPFNGRLTRIFRHPGDFVALGEAIAELRSGEAQAVIGYLRSPVTQRPEVGMEVEIFPRSGSRTSGVKASVLAIGPQFEPLQPAFVRPMPVTLEERGLPVHISLPEGVLLVPGDIVDIRLANPSG